MGLLIQFSKDMSCAIFDVSGQRFQSGLAKAEGIEDFINFSYHLLVCQFMAFPFLGWSCEERK
jgi:hypothetical protein